MAQVVLPLTELTKGKAKSVTWNQEAQAAFDTVKAALANATMLVHPSSSSQTTLTTDASDTAIGAELAQRQDDSTWKPLAFFSRKLTVAEKELLYAAENS
ncbi:Integrase core domain protein [Caligus rogercresseyi]|uniref:Integrase core domain protein n=1 Tax=Caligus rogercresseyi TaxID=217165 RepID=A0A7T8GYE9_CALRO|nr:Integrase core domain protein [Caligus rogercresseyi]